MEHCGKEIRFLVSQLNVSSAASCVTAVGWSEAPTKCLAAGLFPTAGILLTPRQEAGGPRGAGGGRGEGFAIFEACCGGCFHLAHPSGLVFKPWPGGSGMMRTLFQSLPLLPALQSCGADTQRMMSVSNDPSPQVNVYRPPEATHWSDAQMQHEESTLNQLKIWVLLLNVF